MTSTMDDHKAWLRRKSVEEIIECLSRCMPSFIGLVSGRLSHVMEGVDVLMAKIDDAEDYCGDCKGSKKRKAKATKVAKALLAIAETIDSEGAKCAEVATKLRAQAKVWDED
jgi:hypothetical protein